MMKWPETLNICGTEYEVIYHEGPIPDGGSTLYGQVDFNKHTIIVQDDRPAFDVFVTLLHEIFHALDNHGQLGAFEGASDEENKVKRFSTLLADTLVRNGMLEVE